MRVLHLIDSLGAGGAEKSLSELVRALRDREVESSIVCLDERSEGFRDEVVAAGFDVRTLRARTPIGRVRETRALLRQLRPDLLHTTLVRADLVGRLAAVRTRIPVLTSLVNTPYDRERFHDRTIRRWRLAVWRTADGLTARHATTHFHAISNAVRDSYVEHLHLDPSSITVIGRGRDAGRLGEPSPGRRAATRARLGIADDDLVVLNVGRQERQKAHWVLLQAAPILAREVPVVVLVAGRAGNASAELQALLADPAIASVVRMLGHRDDIPDLLAAADVFAFPSIFEGLGGSVIEAMALGLPIVATDLPALREVADEGVNADFVPTQDPEALAGALAALLRDGERRARYGAESRRLFEERHALDRVTAQMVDLYGRIVDAR